MASVMFPDFLGAIGKASAIEANQAQRDWMDEDRAAKKAAGALVPQALGGDREALNRIGSMHPDTAMKIAPLLERMDAGRRAKVKEDADYITQSGMAILSAPPEQQPQLYARVRAEAEASGRNVSNWPTTYDPGWVKFNVDKAQPFAEWFKGRNEGFDLVPSGGGGAAPPATGAPPNREAFLQTITPHAMEVSKATGLDPRLVIAQSALETGYGQSAPGNNYFGVKSHGKPGGQVLATTEAGPGGMYGTRDSFRTYGTPGESARDYVEFLRTNSRYAPVLQAQGIDAQIEALGRSGYASDPQYAAKIRQIVQSLPPVGPQPAGREVAYGGNAAPMPQPPNGMAVPGTPAPMPQPSGIAQGDTAPPADASGTPIPTSDGGSVPREVMRMITPNLPPGTSLGRDRKTGLFKVQEGKFVVYDGNKNPVALVDIPKTQGGDAFSGTGMENQARNALVRGARDPAFTSTPEYAAARSYLLKPRFDPQTQTMIPPEDLSQFPPATYSAQGQIAPAPQQPNAAPPQVGRPGAPPMPAPPGGIVATPVPGLPQKPMTEGQAKAYGFAQRMATANALLDDLAIQGTSKKGRFLEALPGGIGNLAQSPEFQRFERAKRDFMNAQLRDESGAVIGPSEFMSADLQYFPQPGQETNKELLADMAENRRLVIEAMMIKAGMLKRGERYDPPKPKVEGAEKERLVFEARKAIADGRDPNGVREKLKKLGVDPAELDAR